jgi:hypothetical protein
MTASKTARLALMNPAGSDAFTTDDFADTFQKLDANPGILPVPNAASRPSNYTAAQHGSIVHQLDLGILWTWFQPSSGSAGYWRRLGNYGFLGLSSGSGLVTTTNTNYNTGVQVASLSVTIPGGRPITVKMAWDQINNSYSRAVLGYWENNVLIYSETVYAPQTPYPMQGEVTFIRDIAPNAALNLTAKMTLSSYNAAPPNGGGTTQVAGATLTIWES